MSDPASDLRAPARRSLLAPLRARVPATPDSARRPDAVTALLGQIWDDALDPGYAAAAARASTRTPRSRSRRWLGTGLALGLAGVLLAAAAVQADEARPAVAQQRADLVSRIDEQTATNDRTLAAIGAMSADVDRLKNAELSATGAGQALSAQVAAASLLAGSVAVSGPGLTVTMDDAELPGPAASGNLALGRVLDTDLQSAVNGLWAAGADAVSINGHRLTALSAIRSAGDAILVDYRPLVPPYVISAIGNPKTFQATFAAGPAGQALVSLREQYGVQERIEQAGNLSLPAASAPDLRYAKPEESSP